MASIKSWMLGAALAAGTIAMSAAPAHAAHIGIYVGAPVAYVPPSPGPGYFWTAGYYSGGYWVPGRWDFRGVDRDDFYRRDFDRDRYYDRDDRYRDRDDRYRDRDDRYRDRDDRYRGHDGDRFRR